MSFEQWIGVVAFAVAVIVVCVLLLFRRAEQKRLDKIVIAVTTADDLQDILHNVYENIRNGNLGLPEARKLLIDISENATLLEQLLDKLDEGHVFYDCQQLLTAIRDKISDIKCSVIEIVDLIDASEGDV